jgi:chemotaxis signal transduction protein
MQRENRDNNSYSCIAVQIGSRRYACDVVDLQEIIRRPVIEPYYASSTWQTGIIKDSQSEIPVIDLLCRDPQGLSRRDAVLMIMSIDDTRFGFLVDEVYEFIKVELSEIAPLPPLFGGIEGEFVKGIVVYDEQEFYLIDLYRIVSTVSGSVPTAGANTDEGISRK